MDSNVFLIRHAETAWSKSGQHTGRTDLPLTAQGEKDAHTLGPRLHAVTFSHVLTSPAQRARQTCELAGFAQSAEIESDLAEWDYGDYEGRRSEDILKERPDWNLFRDGCPHGETPAQVSERADRLIVRLKALEGIVAVFSHGHFGRVVAARWLELPIIHAQRFLLSPVSVSVLGYEHESFSAPVLALWNAGLTVANKHR